MLGCKIGDKDKIMAGDESQCQNQLSGRRRGTERRHSGDAIDVLRAHPRVTSLPSRAHSAPDVTADMPGPPRKQ